jgi:hypothetical protein
MWSEFFILLCSQKAETCSYPQKDEFSPFSYHISLTTSILILPSHLFLGLPSITSFQAFPAYLCMLCSSHLHLTHSSSVSSSCLYVCLFLSILITADKAVIPIKAQGPTRIKSTDLPKYNRMSLPIRSNTNLKVCEVWHENNRIFNQCL